MIDDWYFMLLWGREGGDFNLLVMLFLLEKGVFVGYFLIFLIEDLNLNICN